MSGCTWPLLSFQRRALWWSVQVSPRLDLAGSPLTDQTWGPQGAKLRAAAVAKARKAALPSPAARPFSESRSSCRGLRGLRVQQGACGGADGPARVLGSPVPSRGQSEHCTRALRRAREVPGRPWTQTRSSPARGHVMGITRELGGLPGSGRPRVLCRAFGDHTQAQSCSSPSGWRRGPGVPVRGGSSGRRRRARRARAVDARTSSGGSERKPSTMSVVEPRSESSARHAGWGAGWTWGAERLSSGGPGWGGVRQRGDRGTGRSGGATPGAGCREQVDPDAGVSGSGLPGTGGAGDGA